MTANARDPQGAASQDGSHPNLLAEFALNLPERWCQACRCVTNHTTESHLAAEAETPEEY